MSDIFPPGSLNNDGDVLPPPVDQTGSASGVSTQFVATADATVSNTASETTLFGSGSGSLTLAANALTTGKTVYVRMMGFITTNVTPTIRIRVKLGSTVIADSVAETSTNIGATARPFVAEAMLTCRSTGSSGTVIGQCGYYAGGTPATNTILIGGSETNAAVTVDTTVTQAIDVMMTWSAAHSQNLVTITNATVTLIG